MSKEIISVTAIDKLRQLKKKYKHPDINKAEYAIGNIRNRSKPEMIYITLEDKEKWMEIGCIDTNTLDVTASDEWYTDKTTKFNASGRLLHKQLMNTLSDLDEYLKAHFRKQLAKKLEKKKPVPENKWIRWRDYQ